MHPLKEMLPTLNDDIYHLVLQAVEDTSYGSRRDQACVDTLLVCCLVSKTWNRLAQPILNRVLIVNNEDHLQRRILRRSRDQLKDVREIILQESWEQNYFRNDVEQILRALPPQILRSFICFDRATLGPFDSLDRSLAGKTSPFTPPPLDIDLSTIREAVLCNMDGGAGWMPFLLRTTNLKDLTMHHLGWTGRSCYANSPLYIPGEGAPFSLKKLEIFRSHIRDDPLRWLLSSSTDSLTHLSVRYLQKEWDTFTCVSKLRAEGLLPKVKHLTFAVSESGASRTSMTL